MRSGRVLLNILVLLAAIVIETVWLSPIGLPGAVPPLTLVATLALARLRNAPNAALLGFAVGIVYDAVPPSLNPLGVSAFSFALIAFLFAQLRTVLEGSQFTLMSGFAIAAAVWVVLQYLLLLVSGAALPPLLNVLARLVTAPIYAVILASIALPASVMLNRWLTGSNSRILRR